MLDNELVVYSSLMFYLQFSLEKHPKGKSDRKVIFRQIKKVLAVERTKDFNAFAKLVEDAHTIMGEIKKDMKLGNVEQDNLLYVNPAMLLKFFRESKPLIYDMWDIPENRYTRYLEIYLNDGLALPTKMYINRMLKKVEEYLDTTA